MRPSLLSHGGRLPWQPRFPGASAPTLWHEPQGCFAQNFDGHCHWHALGATACQTGLRPLIATEASLHTALGYEAFRRPPTG